VTTTGRWLAVGALIVGSSVLLVLARRRQWLSAGAVPPAIAIGLAVLAGTGAGGAVLLLWFLASTSTLTRFRGGRKLRDGAEHAASSTGRSARQVWANGGVAAACALLALVPGLDHVAAGAAGALSAATADSWATEVGTAFRGRTVLVTSLREVSPGTSGGISVVGTVAGLAGSLSSGWLVMIASDWWATPWLGGVASVGSERWLDGSDSGLAAGAAVGLAGAIGMLVDSLLGATLEDRWSRVDNEAVNLLATLTGATVAVFLVRA
jgi:uncharacterized protein (TIGR00297 family)